MFKRTLSVSKSYPHSVLLLGPRGTGKTHWLRRHFPHALYIDLLQMGTYQEFLADPELLGARIPVDHSAYVIIDEIQKIPALLNEIHRLIETRGCRFILTGSSARNLRKKGVNLLAGRALTRRMYPLTVQELGDRFSLTNSLQFGHLPAVYDHADPREYLKSYMQTYLREEVLQEGLTRNLALFSKFLEVASFSQGEVLNYTTIAQEVGSNRHTVANYFNILEDLLIAHQIPTFKKRAKRDIIAHPKFYYFDVGIYRTIRPQGLLDTTAELEGAALETLFLQEILALNSYHQLEYQVYYWRTRSQLEVDFILYGNQGFIAFEIKRKKRLSTDDYKGLLTFFQDYPMSRCYLLYGGTKSYHHHGVEVRPFVETLKILPKLLTES